MSFSSDKRKSAQLGMPYGTACHRLRKSIMFQLVQQAGRDECVRCHRKILTSNELSIEHIANWLHEDTSLFWDLGNIGFSHVKCNVVDRPGMNRKIGPTGTSWCCACTQFLPIGLFSKAVRNFTGLQTECKNCRSQRQKREPWRKVKERNGASGSIRTSNVLKENPDLQSGAANRI